MSPLISVVIPVYNCELFLEKCINSVVNQTYTNLEIILVDDGSTDLSGSMCDLWAKKDKRILVIHKKNGGLSSARNAALEIYKGDYISFIDSDDWVSLNYIKTLYDNLIATNSDISICSSYRVQKDGKKTTWLSFESQAATTNEFLKTLKAPLYSSCYKIYKRFIFNSIRYPVGKTSEDAFVFVETIMHTKKICSTKEKMYFYLNNDSSITNAYLKNCQYLFESRSHVIEMLYRQGYHDAISIYLSDFINQYLNATIKYKKYISHESIKQMKARFKDVKRMIRKSLNSKNRFKINHIILFSVAKKINKKIMFLRLKIKRFCRS